MNVDLNFEFYIGRFFGIRIIEKFLGLFFYVAVWLRYLGIIKIFLDGGVDLNIVVFSSLMLLFFVLSNIRSMG